MKSIMFALTAVGSIVALFALGLFLRAERIWETKTFGVAEQNAQTQVFEQSEAFKEGTRRDFANLYLAYTTEKDPSSKQAILSVIRQRANGCPAELVPANIRSILQ
jgi:hypothetical protein